LTLCINMAKTYEDLVKDIADLLNTGFPAQSSLKISGEVNAPNGLNNKLSFKRSVDEDGNKVEISVESKKLLNLKPNLELTAKLNSNQDWEVGFSSSEFGPKIGVTASSVDFKGKFTYLSSSFSTILGFIYPHKFTKKTPKLTSEFIVRYPEHLFFGAEGSYEIETGTLNGNASISYFGLSGFQPRAFMQSKVKFQEEEVDQEVIVGVSWHQIISPYLKFGTQFEVSSKNVSPSTTVGGEYKINDDQTIKGKISVKPSGKHSKMRFGLGTKKKISNYATIIIGSDLDAHSLLGKNFDGEPHSFGFEIKFS